jgi:hypothetical protein
LILIAGVLAMVARLSIINTHNTTRNVWIVDWTLIVTVFGWALVLGGASRIIAPQVVSDVGSSLKGRPSMTRVIGTFWALLGALLTFQGVRVADAWAPTIGQSEATEWD